MGNHCELDVIVVPTILINNLKGEALLRRRWKGDNRSDRSKRGAVATVINIYH